jgi:ketosteroid isomerase-like protein
VEFPYAPEGHTAVIEGVEGLSKFLGNIGRFTRDMALTEPRIVELGDWAVAEYHGDAVFLDTDLPYSQDYIVLTRIEGGQIVHMREYYDSIRVLRALGDL